MNFDRQFVHPEEEGNLQYWSRKWGVSLPALHNAIIETGSLHIPVLKQKVHESSWRHHPVRETMKVLRSTVNYVF